MKLKALLLTSSLVLASTVFAATTSSLHHPLVKSVHFTINNETGAPIQGLEEMPGVTNMSPTQLTYSTLPAGETNLVFDVVNVGQIGGVALVAQGTDLQLSATNDAKTYSCQGAGTLGVSCYAIMGAHGVYNVIATVIKN